MAEAVIYASEAFDRIAGILVHTPAFTMANVALYRWFAKAATYDTADLRVFHGHLLDYMQSGTPSTYLVSLNQGFPAMFEWFGRDIVGSGEALALMEAIAAETGSLAAIHPHGFVAQATQHIRNLRVTAIVEDLLGCPWPTQVVRLVVARSLWSSCYVYPDTIICPFDPTYATYAAMLAHEGGHMLTLNMVNAPEFAERDRQLASDMAEALAHAVQRCVVDRCGIRYEDLFPNSGIHTHDDYIDKGHPWLKPHATLVDRLAVDLANRGGKPLADLYRQALEDFATSATPGA